MRYRSRGSTSWLEIEIVDPKLTLTQPVEAAADLEKQTKPNPEAENPHELITEEKDTPEIGVD